MHMLHFIQGTLHEKKLGYAVIEVGGMGLKVHINHTTYKKLPSVGEKTKLFCLLRIHDENIETFGFIDEPSLRLFELLNTVSGVGPRSALSVLDIDVVENITAGILERRADLLVRASGIGKKTAERIVLELHNKIEVEGAHALVDTMDANMETEEVLIGLGYDKRDARAAVRAVPTSVVSFEDRLKAALRVLGKNK